MLLSQSLGHVRELACARIYAQVSGVTDDSACFDYGNCGQRLLGRALHRLTGSHFESGAVTGAGELGCCLVITDSAAVVSADAAIRQESACGRLQQERGAALRILEGEDPAHGHIGGLGNLRS